MVAMDTVTQYGVKSSVQAVAVLGIFAVGTMTSRWVGHLDRQSFDRLTLEPPADAIGPRRQNRDGAFRRCDP